MKKTLISLILLFVIVMSLIPTVYASQDTFEYENIESKAQLLSMLGIIEAPDYEMDFSSQPVTKAQFINMCIKLVYGDGLTGLNNQLPYDDVYEGHTYYNSIAYAYSQGIIASSEKLYPDEILDTEFAVDTIVNALGFSKIRKYVKNYSGYYKRSSVLSGTNPIDDKLCIADVYSILYNALNMEMLDISSIIGGTSSAYTITTIGTPAYEVYKLTYLSGRVTATNLASLSGELCGKNQVKIDGVLYNCEKNEPISLIGKYVDAYIDEDNYVYYLFENDDNEIIEINGVDFVDFKSNSISYVNNKGKTRNVTVDNPVIIYNNAEVSGSNYSKSIFDVSEGRISIINNGSKNDVIVIDSYKSFVVGSCSVDSDGSAVVYASNIHNRKLIIDTDYYVSLKDSSGVEITSDAITMNSLITYRVSLCGKYVDAVISKNIVHTNNVTKEYSGNDISSVTLDGVEYPVNKEVMSGKIDVKRKDYFAWYVTPGGHIGAVTMFDTDMDIYGYILGAADDGIFASKVRFLIVDNINYDREHAVILDGKEKIKIDGKPCKNSDEIITALKRYNGTDSLPVIYRVNEAGLIYYIDTPYYDNTNESEQSLRERVLPARDIEKGIFIKRQSNSYRNQFSQMYIATFNTMIVNVTTDGSDAFTVEYLRSDTRIPFNNLMIYSKGDKTYVADIVVNITDSGRTESTEYENNMYIVTGLSKALNEDDEIVDKIELRDVSKEYVYYTNPDVTISALSTLQVGDVVRIAFDTKGSLNGLEIYLSQQETLTGGGKATSSNYNTEHRFIFGKIASVEFDSSLNMYVVAYYISEPSDIETVFVSSGNIIAVEEGRRELVFNPVSIDGLKTSEYYGTAADNVLIKTTWTVCNQMYVFTK